MNKEKNINKEFARLLYDSVMSTEQKKEILTRIENGTMTKEALEKLYTYLVEEEAVRKEMLPSAMEKIKASQEEIIKVQIQKLKNKIN